MQQSLRTLMAEALDYTAAFPPAKLPLTKLQPAQVKELLAEMM